MKKTSIKIKSFLRNKDAIYVLVCVLLLVIIGIFGSYLDSKWLKYVDIEMLTSVVVAFALTSTASIVAKWFTAKFEDSTKLTGNFDALVKKYEANAKMLIHRNTTDSNYKLGRKKTDCKGKLDNKNGDTYTIPVADVIQLYGKETEIHDNKDKKYTLPEFSRKHYKELFSAHGASNTFNQTNLRLDDIFENDKGVQMCFSRTTYFDSLVTNRAIDYKIGGVCVRDLYGCGPFLLPLKESLLSNHMGFNGMVETSDGKFVFIKRHKHVSIGKNTMQCSVASSLKAKRALTEKGELTKEKIINAIICEIEDELNLRKLDNYYERKNNIFEGFSFDKNILYFYRDLMEGGKPQFMFYAKIGVDSTELKKAYTGSKKEFKKNVRDSKLYCKVDGYKMVLVDREKLKDLYLSPDGMVIYNRRYPATPSAVGTVVMMLKAFDEGIVK